MASPYHPFHEPLHHPIIQLFQHTTSPLTASLCIFAIHKAWQAPAMYAVARAHLLLRSRRLPLYGFAGAALSGVGWRTLSLPSTPLAPSALFSPEDTPSVARHLATWPTSILVGDLLHTVRDRLQLSWGAAIVASTLALRVLLMPMQVGLMANSLRLKMIWPELMDLAAELRASPAPAKPAQQLVALLDNAACSPFRQCLSFPIILPATILSVFGAMHNLAHTEQSMGYEGLLWFKDLVSPDITHLLPILSALTWLLNVEMGAGAHYNALPNVRLAVRLSAVAFIPMADTLPAGIHLFWLTSNTFALARGMLLRSSRVRTALAIPLLHAIKDLKHLPSMKPM